MENEKNVYAALSMVIADLRAPKNLYNKFGGYAYRSAEGIFAVAKPLLDKVGAVLTVGDEIVQVGERYYIKATATFRLIEGDNRVVENTAYARETLSRLGMDDSQITGTASSYARKYALNGLFCIDDQKDADTDEFAVRTSQSKIPEANPNYTMSADEKIVIGSLRGKTLKEACLPENRKTFSSFLDWVSKGDKSYDKPQMASQYAYFVKHASAFKEQLAKKEAEEPATAVPLSDT